MKIKRKLIMASLSLLAMISLTGIGNPAHLIHSPMITANAKIKPYDDTVTNRIKRTGYYYDPVSKVTHYIKAGTPLYGGRYGDWYGDMEKGYSHDPYMKSYISGFVGSPKNTYWLVPDIAFKAPAKLSRRPKRIIHKAVKVRKPVKKPSKSSLKKFLKSHSKTYDKSYLAGFRKGFKDEMNYLDKKYSNKPNRDRHTKPISKNYHHTSYSNIKLEWGNPVKHSLNGGNSLWWSKPHYVMTDRNVRAYRISSNPNLSASAKIVGSRIIPKGKIIKGSFTGSTPEGFVISNTSWVINPAYKYGIGNGNERLAKYPQSTYWIARVK